MKPLLSFCLALILSLNLLIAPALAWVSHPVDMGEVGVDVGASDWAVKEIKAAYEAKLIPELTDNPAFQDAITRLQFAELVVNFTEKVIGMGNNLFAPGDTTNRKQIAAMLHRAIPYINVEANRQLAPKAADLSKFSDKGQVSAWAAEGVGTLAANGTMAGTSDTALSPKASCTIEQSILLIYRLYEKAN